MRPYTPWVSSAGPPVKNSVFVGWLLMPLPNAMPHSPSIAIGAPSALLSVPSFAPVDVTLSELALETFFPADTATAALLYAAAAR